MARCGSFPCCLDKWGSIRKCIVAVCRTIVLLWAGAWSLFFALDGLQVPVVAWFLPGPHYIQLHPLTGLQMHANNANTNMNTLNHFLSFSTGAAVFLFLFICLFLFCRVFQDVCPLTSCRLTFLSFLPTSTPLSGTVTSFNKENIQLKVYNKSSPWTLQFGKRPPGPQSGMERSWAGHIKINKLVDRDSWNK